MDGTKQAAKAKEAAASPRQPTRSQEEEHQKKQQYAAQQKSLPVASNCMRRPAGSSRRTLGSALPSWKSRSRKNKPWWQTVARTAGQLQSVRTKLETKTKKLEDLRAKLAAIESSIKEEEAEKAALEVREQELSRLCDAPAPSTCGGADNKEQAAAIMQRMGLVHSLPEMVRQSEQGKQKLEALQQSILEVQALYVASTGEKAPTEQQPEGGEDDGDVSMVDQNLLEGILKRHLGEKLQQEAIHTLCSELAEARGPKRQQRQTTADEKGEPGQG